MKLSEVVKILRPEDNFNIHDVDLTTVSIDSRTVVPETLFIAIKGERLDGHDYVEEAIQKGAVAILCERPLKNLTRPQIIVKDTKVALASLASYHRESIQCPIVALTGSNGKTTVKEMIAGILPHPSHHTPGNLNNHLGVPLSLLQLKPEHRYAVFELGANHLGEIAYSVQLVKPKVSLINNIGPAHIAMFGSIEAVASAKGEIYQGLDSQGIAVVNEDDAFAHFWDELLSDKRVLRFSRHKKVDVYASEIHVNPNGCAQFKLHYLKETAIVHLNVPGLHQVHNALAAATACIALNLDLPLIQKGLATFKGVSGRMTLLKGLNGSTIIDDSYNANLRSVLTAIDFLSTRKGRRILVLGDLGELGSWTGAHHQEIGEQAKKQGIDYLYSCGEHSRFSSVAFGEEGYHFETQPDLIKALCSKLDQTTTVLVKGSRFAKMENIVQQIILGGG